MPVDVPVQVSGRAVRVSTCGVRRRCWLERRELTRFTAAPRWATNDDALTQLRMTINNMQRTSW